MENETLKKVSGGLMGLGCLIPVVIILCIMIFAPKHNDVASAPDYAPQMKVLCDKLAGTGVSATWPGDGNDFVLRLDLPRMNSELSPYDARAMALDTYNAFVEVREKSGVPTPTNCIVHVYDDTGKQLAHASGSGADN